MLSLRPTTKYNALLSHWPNRFGKDVISVNLLFDFALNDPTDLEALQEHPHRRRWRDGLRIWKEPHPDEPPLA